MLLLQKRNEGEWCVYTISNKRVWAFFAYMAVYVGSWFVLGAFPTLIVILAIPIFIAWYELYTYMIARMGAKEQKKNTGNGFTEVWTKK